MELSFKFYTTQEIAVVRKCSNYCKTDISIQYFPVHKEDGVSSESYICWTDNIK